MPADFRVSISNPPGPAAYPVSSYSWLLVPASIPDAARRTAVKGFLKWVLTDGQKLAVPLHYAPIPQEIASQATAALEQIR
jgi:phosphate transport system substrate-binding protein